MEVMIAIIVVWPGSGLNKHIQRRCVITEKRHRYINQRNAQQLRPIAVKVQPQFMEIKRQF